MFVLTRAAVLGSLAAVVMLAQQPIFDAASVKVVKLASHPVFGNSGGPGTSDPGRVHLCCVGMFSLVMRAYDVEVDQIRGLPGSWRTWGLTFIRSTQLCQRIRREQSSSP